MVSGISFLAALAVAQTTLPRAEPVRRAASAGVTVIAMEDIRFVPVKRSKGEVRKDKSIRRTGPGYVLIEFF